MAASGEPYSVAARHLVGPGAAEPPIAAKVAACASATAGEPGARMGIRVMTGLPWVETAETPPEQRRGGVQGLARRPPGTLVHEGTHIAGEGFAEPAARRYMIDGGGLGGFVCREGIVEQGRHGWRLGRPRGESGQVIVLHWLWPLWTGTVTARVVGARGGTRRFLSAADRRSRLGPCARGRRERMAFLLPPWCRSTGDGGTGRLDRRPARPAGALHAVVNRRSEPARARGPGRPGIDGRCRTVGLWYFRRPPGRSRFPYQVYLAQVSA